MTLLRKFDPYVISMRANAEGAASPQGTSGSDTGGGFPCEECGQPFKNAQGLAGHRRLAHSTSTRTELETRESELAERERAAKSREAEVARQAEVARRREAEVERRRKEIDETGPSSIGMLRCRECGSWFENNGNLRRHERTIHPIEDAVAAEVGRSRERVLHEWTEAARKQKANPDKSAEWVVNQFWWPTDKKILRALLARNATFRFSEE